MANVDKRNVSNQSYNPSNVSDLSESMTERKSPHNQSAYDSAYWQGRAFERRAYDEQVARSREGESAANGLLVGMILTALVALGAGFFYFLNQNEQLPKSLNITVPKPSPNQVKTETRERIIERDRIVPVPQDVPNPEVNIQVPNPIQNNSTQTTPSQPPVQSQNGSSSNSTEAPPAN